MDIKIKERFLQNAKLPFNVVRGNILQRNKKAADMFHRFYTEINPLCENDRCHPSVLKNILDRVLAPYTIRWTVEEQENPKFSASLGSIIKLAPDSDGNIIINHLGYKFLFPLINNEQNPINKYIVFHEARHFFDHIFNPKYSMLRCEKSANHESSKKDFTKLHDMFLDNLDKPVDLKEFQSKVEKIIKHIPDTITIDCLQNIRYALMTEINAYNEEVKCLKKDGKQSDAAVLKNFLAKYCMFRPKLSYANRLLKTLIEKERAANYDKVRQIKP